MTKKEVTNKKNKKKKTTKKKQQKKPHASLDFLKSSDEKLVSTLEWP